MEVKAGAYELESKKQVLITQGTESYLQDNYDDTKNFNIHNCFQQILASFSILDGNKNLSKLLMDYAKEML